MHDAPQSSRIWRCDLNLNSWARARKKVCKRSEGTLSLLFVKILVFVLVHGGEDTEGTVQVSAKLTDNNAKL